ncbi:MAG: MBOAT family O-acyltransferase, partial [Gammaproteobacteria bacterium]
MLFSSQAFLLLFLPLTLLAYYAAAVSRRARIALITLASFVFYAWWDPRFVPLLAGLIGLNWLIVRVHEARGHSFVLTVGIGANLLFLVLFKYANFLAENLLNVVGVEHEPWGLILPLGISFFTFQQISYLVDRRRGEAPVYGLLDYAAYVSFFPQLIAGPIVRHNQLIAQFDPDPRISANLEMAGRGLALFALGLTKKVFFADELAPIADAGFDIAAHGGVIAFGDSWLSATAYTLQLYFDFSAYSDMAIGLGALFGLRLPLNFDAPYRALD